MSLLALSHLMLSHSWSNALSDNLMETFRAAGQGHVLRWWDELDAAARARLTSQLRQVDLRQIEELAARIRSGGFRQAECGKIECPAYVALGDPGRVAARAAGEKLIRAGKVAALVVAGGQGTRLGFSGPKGAFPIGAVSGKSLFQIHSERLLACRRKYGVAMPWYIMTSEATDAPTREYFRKERFFGIPQEDVRFFTQGMMPALDRAFKLVPIAKDQILLSPNGHGGTLQALAQSGMLDDMERRGIEEISYFQVDNPVVPAADPVFLGAHHAAGAQMSSKMLWKREPEEPLGAFVLAGGKLVVKEYSDLTPEEMNRRTPDGKLMFGLGSIAIHAIRVDFVREQTAEGLRLPFHLAEKSSPWMNEKGETVSPQGKEKNVYKFETFIFDALAETRRSVILEVRREEEFSPVKNADGKDSAASSRRDMTALYAGWLEAAGVSVPRDANGAPLHPIEISPLYAQDAEELAARRPGKLNLNAPLYLGAAVD